MQTQEKLSDLEEERALIAQWKSHGCKASLDLLVRRLAGQVKHMARRRAGGRDIIDDLYSEGMMSLVRTLERYEPVGDVPFMGYASPFIRSAMSEEAYRLFQPVDIPRDHLRAARRGDLPNGEMEIVKSALKCGDVDEIPSSQSGADQLTGEVSMMRSQAQHNLTGLISYAMKDLTPVERRLIKRRIQPGGKDLAGVAKTMGISEYMARKMEARAMGRMKAALVKSGLTPTFPEMV